MSDNDIAFAQKNFRASKAISLTKLKKITSTEILLKKKDMNKDLILALLRKNIQDLDMLTESFMEMNELPPAILHLTMQKVTEIQQYLEELINESASVKKPVDKQTLQPDNLRDEKRNDFSHSPENWTDNFNELSENLVEEVEIESANDTEFQIGEVESDKEKVETAFPFAESSSVESVIQSAETANETTKDDRQQHESEETPFVFSQSEINDKNEETKLLVAEEKKETYPNESEIKEPATIPLQEKFSKIPDNSLGATLANQKIDDIKKAISIGDRFRFQRELFRGNGEDMNKTLNYLNQLATFDEAVSFLQAKYKWEKENETAQDFYQILKRRFL